MLTEAGAKLKPVIKGLGIDKFKQKNGFLL